jgi:hypothetical protein
MVIKYPSHHFSMILSPGLMEKQALLFIDSLKKLHNYNLINYRITLLIPEKEKLTCQKLLDPSVNIVEYKVDPIFKFPWSSYPRWNIDSDKELIIGIDTDVIVCNNYLNDLLKYKNFNLSGKLAISNPLKMETWKKLFQKCNTEWPTRIYKYIYGEDGPLYINNGLVIMQSKYAKKMKECSYSILKIINEDVYDSIYITQIATTIAIHKLKLTYSIMDEHFHQFDFLNNKITDKTMFYHYFSSKKPLIRFV